MSRYFAAAALSRRRRRNTLVFNQIINSLSHGISFVQVQQRWIFSVGKGRADSYEI